MTVSYLAPVWYGHSYEGDIDRLQGEHTQHKGDDEEEDLVCACPPDLTQQVVKVQWAAGR